MAAMIANIAKRTGPADHIYFFTAYIPMGE